MLFSYNSIYDQIYDKPGSPIISFHLLHFTTWSFPRNLIHICVYGVVYVHACEDGDG